MPQSKSIGYKEDIIQSRQKLSRQIDELNNFSKHQIIKKQYRMNDPDLKQYIQNLIEPLYLKIQSLQKENNQLKKRVGTLQTLIMTQSSKTYMKNTASRQNHLQESVISRRDDQNRSVSGGKDKPGWKSNTKIQQPKPISRQPVHHEKLKLKPPIPRMNSKTPTKTTDSLARDKSPPFEKRTTNGSKIEADKKQNPIITPTTPTKQQTFTSPSKTNAFTNDLEDTPSSKASKVSSIQMGKPTIYIQKDSKKNSIVNSPRQTPNLQRSNVTQKGESKTGVTVPDLDSTTKSQPNLQ